MMLKSHEISAILRAVSQVTKDYFSWATAPLVKRLNEVDERVIELSARPPPERGEKGEPGARGESIIGPPGMDGASVLSGDGPPLGAIGKQGDHYIDLLTGDVYRCD